MISFVYFCSTSCLRCNQVACISFSILHSISWEEGTTILFIPSIDILLGCSLFIAIMTNAVMKFMYKLYGSIRKMLPKIHQRVGLGRSLQDDSKFHLERYTNTFELIRWGWVCYLSFKTLYNILSQSQKWKLYGTGIKLSGTGIDPITGKNFIRKWWM